jgi:excisionase family DNA binding protein
MDEPLDLDALAAAIADKLADRLAAPTQRYLGVAEAARYTGLSADSVRSMIAGGKLTALRPVPGRIVLDKRELDSVVQGATRRPATGRGIRPVNE